MGQCVSQWITLGWTIFKHPGMNKTPNHILPTTTTLSSWSLLYCGVPVAVGPLVPHCAHPWMPAIASSTDRSSFSGRSASKRLNMGKTTDRCPKQQGERVPLPTTTCHLKPSPSGCAELVSVSITVGKSTVLHLPHTWRVVTTKLNPSAFPRLSACSLALQMQRSTPEPTDSFFNCNWQSFCSSPCFQSWEPSKISRKNHDYFSLRSSTGNRLQEKSS